jgi:SAM-dependent methyltransferase
VNGDIEFDRIAPVYDETRRAPTEEELAALSEVLSGSRTVLDAGVGTGRFALPLHERHFDVVGVDLSLEMMRRAQAKGLGSLARADVRRLPLRDRAVDAVFSAHVLQLIPDPRAMLAELGRVARRVVVVELPSWQERRDATRWREVRERYRTLAAELGYPLPPRGARHWHTLEELTAIAPPKEVRTVPGPPALSPNGEDGLHRWEARAYGTSRIPSEVHEEIVRRIRAEFPRSGPRTERIRAERFVAWEPASLTAPTSRPSDGSA